MMRKIYGDGQWIDQTPKCRIHGATSLICPACIASKRSVKKAEASRANGLKGGRGRKKVKP